MKRRGGGGKEGLDVIICLSLSLKLASVVFIINAKLFAPQIQLF